MMQTNQCKVGQRCPQRAANSPKQTQPENSHVDLNHHATARWGQRRPTVPMACIFKFLLAFAVIAFEASAMAQANSSARFRLITLDPGHFHAALVQKFMYADVDPDVNVFAPAGDDLQEYLNRILSYNTRPDQPTHWREVVYTGADFFPQMLSRKPGNVVVLAGNNARKGDYILQSVKAGLNVLADKPMAITPADFGKLQAAFAIAASNHVMLYDIMTERYEITTVLQKELSQQPALFGKLLTGSMEGPAITKESVHHFSKVVSGKPLKRPAWYFDVRQEGEGIVDVTTHLVDLVQWEAFPEQTLSPADVEMLNARRWFTWITPAQFKQVTGLDSFPDFLQSDVKNGALQVLANGEFTYRLKGIYAKVSVMWDFEAPPGAGDRHYSMMRGTKANLVIRQGPEQKFKPVLYVEKTPTADDASFERLLKESIDGLQKKYPGIGFRRDGQAWQVTVPEKYDVGHESHFAAVTETFLGYLRAGKMPDWEVPNMITKYATIMKAYEMSR
jgi:predicted dehydrogenase